jgi:hypothetical membrane protein
MKRVSAVAVLAFTAIVLAGPIYAVDGYSAVSHLISELGAQKTQNNFIMIAGFLILGTGIIISSLTNMSFAMVPFILFGIFMSSAGMFPHRPVDTALEYNATFHALHSASATLAGISLAAGFVWQGILSRTAVSRAVCLYLATACIVFPLLMLALPGYQGIIQRLMYLQFFLWIISNHPGKIMSGKSP